MIFYLQVKVMKQKIDALPQNDYRILNPPPLPLPRTGKPPKN